MSPFIQFFFKIMHIMCCNNFITQCIPLFHRSIWKTVFSNIPHTLPHSNLYMSSCPSIFFKCQHQVFLVYLFNAIDSSFYSIFLSSSVRSFSSGTKFVAIF
ncbi:hypothetical protein E2C01_094892 [Portunus trituberculatus]|uniref:Uncharacterized protein n=1 Tax=Portunus trituberculatus TaxID=210409 RepID=A0A5B7JYT9_PORTR|nr:hypothetical protein [Portunus trituberculatus]